MSGKSIPPKTKLDRSQKAAIAEFLLDGVEEKQIVKHLVDAGYSQTIARTEVHKAANSPYVDAGKVFAQRVQKRTWVIDTYAKLYRMRPEAKGIFSIPAESLNPQAFFAEFYTRNTPLLIKGLIKDWPATTKWSLDYFEAVAGDQNVEIQFGRTKNPRYEQQTLDHKKAMPFRDFLTLMRKNETTNDYYMTANNSGLNGNALQPLWKDTRPLDGYLTSTQGQGFFWMGPKGTLTPFHHDLTNNFLMQMQGRKRVVLAPAVEIARMKNSEHCYSQFAITPQAILDIPEQYRPLMVECVIEPGDVLFLPVGWWHYVEGLDMTFGMSFTNFCWDNDFYSFYNTYQRV